MTQLDKGILELELDNLIIFSETTLDDLKKLKDRFKIIGYPESNSGVAYTKNIETIDGSPFMLGIRFVNNKIITINLRPYVKYPKNMKDTLERQQLRYMACSRWTFRRLGKPHEKVNSVESTELGLSDTETYKFDFGIISVIQNIRLHDYTDGGYLVIRYNTEKEEAE